MKQILGLTDDASQRITIPLPDGTTATMTMTFRPQQIGWFYDLIWNGNQTTYPIYGRRIVTSPNMIRQFRNILPFGLAVTYVNNAEPTGQEDWVNGNASMYLLDTTDIASVEATIFPGN